VSSCTLDDQVRVRLLHPMDDRLVEWAGTGDMRRDLHIFGHRPPNGVEETLAVRNAILPRLGDPGGVVGMPQGKSMLRIAQE